MIKIVYFVNFLLLLWFLLFQNKNYRSSLKWLLLFLVFPLFSFIIYFFVGIGIKIDKKRYQQVKTRVEKIFQPIENSYMCNNLEVEEVLKHNINLGAFELSYYNDVYYFCDGDEYYDSLLSDILKAKHSIHIEMYIFKDDQFGNDLMDLLLKKAQEGVKVKIVYDPNGNLRNKFGWHKKYANKNLTIVTCYPFIHQIRNFNYRNHRKIIVIDGSIAYLGGFNFGLEYASLDDKVNPFRDTQIKLQGDCDSVLQKQFLIDFYYAYSFKKREFDIDVSSEDIKINRVKKMLPIQIGSTSYSIRENIKRMKLKIISLAKKEIFIQTPYFILDISMMEILKMQILSGVKVNIMIPLKYDQKIPYCATIANCKELYNLGAKIYLYEGFIHAKTLIVDDKFLVIGSSNFDIRSFSSNLETYAYIYSYNEVNRYKNIFHIDICSSIEFDEKMESRFHHTYNFGYKVFKLISSIL